MLTQPFLPKRRSSDSLVDDIQRHPVSCFTKIGQGTVGSAYSCYYQGGESVVIKMIQKNERWCFAQTMREIIALNSLKDVRNIVNLTSLRFCDHEVILCFQRHDFDLSLFIKKCSWKTRKNHLGRVLSNLSTALSMMHREGFYHLDIKPNNVFVNNRCTNLLEGSDDDVTFTLGDLSHARSKEANATTDGFAPLYAPPEKYLTYLASLRYSHSYNHKTDIWGLGLVLFEYINGGPLYNRDQECLDEIDVARSILTLDRYPSYLDPKRGVVLRQYLRKEGPEIDRYYDQISKCLMFHQDQRQLPVLGKLDKVKLVEVDLPKGSGLRNTLRWSIIKNLGVLLVDDLQVMFPVFVYNFDTILAETGMEKMVEKAAAIIKSLQCFFCKRKNKYLNSFTEGFLVKKVNDEIMSEISTLLVVPRALLKKRSFFDPRPDKFYLIESPTS